VSRGGAGAPPPTAAGAKWATVAAVLAAALALALGTVGLADASLWLDETFSVFDARRDVVDIFAMRGEAYGGAHHPPGYFLLLKATIAVCGTAEVCVRAPSVAANAGIAAMVVVLGARLFGLGAGAVAGVVWAAMPYAIKYGQQARHYTLLALVAAIALWLVVRVLDRARDAGQPRDGEMVALGLAAAAAAWLHLFALPFVGTLAALTAAAAWIVRRSPSAPTPRQWGLTIVAGAIACAPLVPGMWTVWVTGGGGQLASAAGPVENAWPLVVDLATFGLDTPWVPAVAACAVSVPTWRARGCVAALGLLAALPMSVIFVRNPEHFVTLRYFMPSLVPVALLVAAGVAGIAGVLGAARARWLPRTGPALTAALTAAILAVPAWRVGVLYVSGLRKQWATSGFEPWRDVAAAIRGGAGRGDVAVLVPFELVAYPFAVYELPISAHAPADIAEVMAGRPQGVFVVSSHVDGPERAAQRRAVLRRVAAAGYVRTELEGLPGQRSIEVLLYRPRSRR